MADGDSGDTSDTVTPAMSCGQAKDTQYLFKQTLS